MITGLIDLAHWEDNMDLQGHRVGNHPANIGAAAAANTGGPHDLVAVFAKTGQGVGSPDPSFADFRDQTYRAGLVFADYHFLTNQHSGTEQANDYIARWDPSAAFHMVDCEAEPQHGHTVTREQIEDCVTRIHEVTGVWPVFYTYPSFLANLKIPAGSPILNCPLFLAAYGEKPKHAPAPFQSIALWQYTDVHDGPHDRTAYPRETPGLGRKVDRSCFDGTLDDFKAWCRAAGR